MKFGISPWIGMFAAAGLGGVAAFAIAIPTMRLQGHYFALATLAFGEVLRVIANVWTSVTGGSSGISVPFSPPSLANYSFKLLRPHAYIALAALVIVTVIFEAIRTSAMGYRLRAIKENPSAAEVIGINTTKVKLQAAIISGMLMAMLGTLYGPGRGVLRSRYGFQRRIDFDPRCSHCHSRRHWHRGRADHRGALHHPA